MRRRGLGLLVAAAVVGIVPAAQAAPSPSPSPAPAGVSVAPTADSPHRSTSGTFAELGTVQSGHPVRDVVLVTNGADVQQAVLLYAADAIPSRGGGFAFRARTDPEQQFGRWARLEQSRLVLAPHGTARVGYVVAVADDAQGGEYVGGVIAEPDVSHAQTGITTVTRFAMAVYLRVPGGAPSATPGRGRPNGTLVVTRLRARPHGSRICPVVSYRNDSQDILDPKVRVRSHGLLGGGSYAQQRAGAVLPGTSADVALPCLSRPIGPGRLEVTLTTPRGQQHTAVSATWFPWPLLISLLLLLLLLGALLSTLLRGLAQRRSAERRID